MNTNNLKSLALIASISFPLTSFLGMESNFKAEQLKNERVKSAYQEKGQEVSNLLEKKRIKTPQVFIRAFKQEEILEVWAKNPSDKHYQKLKAYDFCILSGTIGPKRRRGDLQTPEGFYYINRFNPWSNYHLSLGLNYPNQSDKILGYQASLGGDIFIHGDCVSIGCIPITDEYIKEFYILCVEAKNGGQNHIPVHIFPTKLSDENLENLKQSFKTDHELIKFWCNLKTTYDYFEAHKSLPNIKVLANGMYSFI